MITRFIMFTLGSLLALPVLHAPAQAQAACPTGTTRSGDRCLTPFEMLTKQLNDAAAKMAGATAWLNCPQGQTTLFDKQRCVAIEPWGTRTPLPDGTVIAIRLRHVMTDRQGNSAPYPNWLGLSPNDNTTIGSVGSMLTSTGLFSVKTFVPPARADAARFDLPWYILRAANGRYLRWDSTMMADRDEAGASVFARGWGGGKEADFRAIGITWSQAAEHIRTYTLVNAVFPSYCAAAMGSAASPVLSFSSDCFYSRSVDYFIVKM